MKMRAGVSKVKVDGIEYTLNEGDQIRYPVDLSATDYMLFLAKIAHGYAWLKRGSMCCTEFFLPKLILGETSDLMTYVGNAETLVNNMPKSSAAVGLQDRVNGPFLTVMIQFFKNEVSDPPIYEVVVGRT